MLIEFNRKSENLSGKDFCEQVADVMLKPLRLSCGRFVDVNQEFNVFYEVPMNKTQRVFASFLAIILFPLAIPLTLIGLALNACSISYQKISKVYVAKNYILPPRRYPPIGSLDTIRLGANGRGESVHGRATFISDEEILKIHSMKFLRSPFSPNQSSDAEQAEKGLAITKTGKHVILQQGNRACVPTAVAMIVLDNGGSPNFDSLRFTNLATEAQSMQWIREAGFNPKMQVLSPNHKEQVLADLLKQNGPGILGVSPPNIGGHVIILDAISLETRTAIIRDPYHGWMVTIRLDTLLRMAPSYFLQIQK